MAFSRPGAPAPTMSANTTGTTTAARMTAMQQRAAQSGALQAASPAKPVEITSADGQHMTVSFSDVRNFICQKATDAECKIFLETCKQYRLNPFTKEAYLIHYDNNSEDTPSTIVLGKNCYLQMAERHPSYDGFEAGVIIFDKVAGEYHYFELKTIETPSIPLEKILGRFDREQQKYHKLKHITDMAHAASFKGQTAHVVINYRGKVNRTFAVPAGAVLEYMQTQTRKSIPWQWAALNGIEVEQHLLRVHWRYDVEGLLRVLEGGSTE